MIIKQVSVFLENRTGHLLELVKSLGDNGINISALSIAETAEYGIARMIVDNTENAVQKLKAAGYQVNVAEVICVETPDEPGELAKALTGFAEKDINVSYMYGYAADGVARLIMKVSHPEEAIKTLKG